MVVIPVEEEDWEEELGLTDEDDDTEEELGFTDEEDEDTEDELEATDEDEFEDVTILALSQSYVRLKLLYHLV